MTQNELKENYLLASINNLNIETQLQLVYELLETIINDMTYNIETNEDKNNYNQLVTISLRLKRIVGGLYED